MALSTSILRLFASELLPRLEGGSVIALGVPEIGPDRKELSAIFGRPIPEASFGALMDAIGFTESRTLDVSDYQGCDYVADLNQPLRDLPQFDLVIDNGTIEHCFDVAQAFFNAKSLCAPGGFVLHNNPASSLGHGFWSMSPCVYFDFYEANGFEVDLYLRDITANRWEQLVYQPKLNRILSGKFIVNAIARRVEEVPDYVPAQRWCPTLQAETNGGSHEIDPAEARRPYVPRRATPTPKTRGAATKMNLTGVVSNAVETLKTYPDRTAPGSVARKLRKLTRDPAAFFRDSKLTTRD